MPVVLILLWVLAVGLGATAYFRSGDEHLRGLRFARKQFLQILPRVILALMTAGFVAQIMPKELVAGWLGPASGLQGILVAAVLGAILPAGPMVAFPIALVLLKSGVGIPQLIAMLAAWSMFAAHRIIGYELPLMGWRFSVVRLSASLPLPILAGLAAWLVAAAYG